MGGDEGGTREGWGVMVKGEGSRESDGGRKEGQRVMEDGRREGE